MTFSGNNTFTGKTWLMNGLTLVLANQNALSGSTYIGGESNTEGGGTLVFANIPGHAFTFGGLQLEDWCCRNKRYHSSGHRWKSGCPDRGRQQSEHRIPGALERLRLLHQGRLRHADSLRQQHLRRADHLSTGTLALGLDNAIPSGAGKGDVVVNSGATLIWPAIT